MSPTAMKLRNRKPKAPTRHNKVRPARLYAPEDEGRFDRLAVRCREALTRYRNDDPDGYIAMISSRSMDTDAHVVRFLRAVEMLGRPFVDDVWFSVKHIWRTAMQENLFPDDPELRRLCDTGALIGALRNISPSVLMRIHRMKQVYTRDQTGGVDVVPGTCSILTCLRPRVGCDRGAPSARNLLHEPAPLLCGS